MSKNKYYRILGKRETWKIGDVSCYLGMIRPAEVDKIPEVKKAHEFLDGCHAPRTDVGGEILSLLGRMNRCYGFTGDPWHSASEPPKPEDFEPTGKIDVEMCDGSIWLWTKGTLPLPLGAKNWRQLTPPK